MNNDKRILPITWKKTENGVEVAYCGERKVGWIKPSLTTRGSKNSTYYPTILNDMVKLKVQEYSKIEEAKEVVESVLNDVISSMLVPTKK